MTEKDSGDYKEVSIAEYQALRHMEKLLDEGSIETAKRYSDSAKILRMPDGEAFVEQFIEDHWDEDAYDTSEELDHLMGDTDHAIAHGYQAALIDLKETFERWKEILGR